ncbi:MAG: IPTL-CTERM sorting domain-containing protein [Casimicrobiaceae bacterium]
MGAFALSSANAGIVTPAAGTAGAGVETHPAAQAEVVPSIEILSEQPNIAGRCNGAAFDINTFINVTALTSARVRVSSPALDPSLLEQFTDTTGANLGAFNAVYPTFHILAFGGGLAPNTPITISIATFTGPNLTGTVTFTSTVTFNCTTGAISRLARSPPILGAIPALDRTGLALLAIALALLGAYASRARLARARRGG